MKAQYMVSDKYTLWFEDTGNGVITRKAIWCEEDYQDLWNGCWGVRHGNTGTPTTATATSLAASMVIP